MPNGGSSTVRPLTVVIVSVPRGGQYNEKTGMIVYPDGTETDPPPYVPTPPPSDELPVLDFEREPAEPEPVEEAEVLDLEAEPIVRLDRWRDRRSGGDDPAG